MSALLQISGFLSPDLLVPVVKPRLKTHLGAGPWAMAALHMVLRVGRTLGKHLPKVTGNCWKMRTFSAASSDASRIDVRQSWNSLTGSQKQAWNVLGVEGATMWNLGIRLAVWGCNFKGGLHEIIYLFASSLDYFFEHGPMSRMLILIIIAPTKEALIATR